MSTDSTALVRCLNCCKKTRMRTVLKRLPVYHEVDKCYNSFRTEEICFCGPAFMVYSNMDTMMK